MKKLKQKKYWIAHFNDEKYVKIREQILNSFKDLIFEEGPHKYYLHGKEITCVSNVTHLFKPHFDEDKMAQETYERNFDNVDSKYYKMTPEMIKEEWHKISKHACSHGTERHEFAESIFYFMTNQFDKILPQFKDRLQYDEETGEPIFIAKEPKEVAAEQFYEELPDSLIPILAETKVYNEKLGYSGTFDLLTYYDATVDGKSDEKSGLVVMDWKGLALDTEILTTNGWKTMGDLKVGDYVFDKDGKPTKILHVSEIHHNPCYKITFDNNAEVICDADHRWEIMFKRGKKEKYKVFTCKELYEYMQDLNRKNTFKIPKIVNTKPTMLNEKVDLKIDPYVLGVWLGDGHSSCGMVTNMYEGIFNEIRKRGFEIGEDVSQGGCGKATTRTIMKLLPLLKSYNLINNKHIPYEYLISDYEVKFQILQGLMDTDGYYNQKRGRYVLSTTRLNQVDFCVKLLSSLGIRATVLDYFKKLNGKKIQCYDVAFWCDEYPFLVREVEVTKKPKTDCRTFKNIKKIEPVETVETKCIEVDSPTHTYLCTRHLIVTHNTNKDLYKNFKEEKLLHPFEGLLDMPLSIYKLQLSLYQICLEKIGLKAIARRIMWLLPNGTYDKIPLESYTKQLEEELTAHPIKL